MPASPVIALRLSSFVSLIPPSLPARYLPRLSFRQEDGGRSGGAVSPSPRDYVCADVGTREDERMPDAVRKVLFSSIQASL